MFHTEQLANCHAWARKSPLFTAANAPYGRTGINGSRTVILSWKAIPEPLAEEKGRWRMARKRSTTAAETKSRKQNQQPHGKIDSLAKLAAEYEKGKQ